MGEPKVEIIYNVGKASELPVVASPVDEEKMKKLLEMRK
jgi:hypothetical protein